MDDCEKFIYKIKKFEDIGLQIKKRKLITEKKLQINYKEKLCNNKLILT